MNSVYPACRYTTAKRGASSTRVVTPYNIKIKSKRCRRRTGTCNLFWFKATQKLTTSMIRAKMFGTGNTETRPRSVICRTFTEWSERNHSAKAHRGSSTNVISRKIETVDHTLTLLSSFALQTPQKLAYEGSMSLQFVQRILFVRIRLILGSVNFTLRFMPSSNSAYSFS